MKELFVVKNKSGEIVQGGLRNKEVAKTVRNRLQAETKDGIPGNNEKDNEQKRMALKSDHHNWAFFVAPGKDHHHMEPRKDI